VVEAQTAKSPNGWAPLNRICSHARTQGARWISPAPAILFSFICLATSS
jgi:hypothetical protein